MVSKQGAIDCNGHSVYTVRNIAQLIKIMWEIEFLRIAYDMKQMKVLFI